MILSNFGPSTAPHHFAPSKYTPTASTPPYGTPTMPNDREPSLTMVFPPHEFEVLTCDWNKYNEWIIITASMDKSIKVWDVRSFRVLIVVMNKNGYAVRKVRFLPHVQNLMVSCSYDMAVCV
ncbi:hypothetical protein AHAS_Ahas06G0198300 [Arachis hypogaea]